MDFWTIYLISALVGIGLFFACRELFCWYFKVNKIKETVELIKQQNLLIMQSLGISPPAEALKEAPEANTPPEPVELKDNQWLCPKCGAVNSKTDNLYCNICAYKNKV